MHVCSVAQSCPTLCNPTDCSPPGFSVQTILQARILKWVAMPSSRGSSQPRTEPLSLMSPELTGGFFITSTVWETKDGKGVFAKSNASDHIHLMLWMRQANLDHVVQNYLNWNWRKEFPKKQKKKKKGRKEGRKEGSNEPNYISSWWYNDRELFQMSLKYSIVHIAWYKADKKI